MAHPDISFLTATEIRFGRGQSHSAAAAVKTLGKRALLVCGSTVSRVDWLAGQIDPVALFAVPREPDVALITAGVAMAREAGADVVVAIGGGAVLDAGKAIAALVPATRPLMDHLEVVGKGLPLDHAPLAFVALPTTAGTGAEVTKNAVIGVPEFGRKVSLRDNRMLPDLAIIDPQLTDSCPKAVTLASGLDAVTQVIEPYLSTKANRLTDALCRDAIPMGLRALVRLMDRECADARDDLAWTSVCGGLALANAGLGAVHGLAGPIGGQTNAPHGAVCGALLPHVLRANRAAPRMDEVTAWLSDVFGPDPVAALDAWSRSHGLRGLGAMGMTTDLCAPIAEASLSSSSMKGNPVPLSQDDLVGIMMRAF